MLKRILDLSLAHGISHVSSNLHAAEVLANIYRQKLPGDIVILSPGHCGLALYCMLEQLSGGPNAEALLKQHGEQPHLDPKHGIHCTTGSLGMGLTVAVGYALAYPRVKIHVVLSDGECAEGCVWESLAFIQKANLRNLSVHVIANGFCALGTVDLEYLEARLRAFLPDIALHRPLYDLLPAGVQSHYKNLTKETHAEAIRRLAA